MEAGFPRLHRTRVQRYEQAVVKLCTACRSPWLRATGCLADGEGNAGASRAPVDVEHAAFGIVFD